MNIEHYNMGRRQPKGAELSSTRRRASANHLLLSVPLVTRSAESVAVGDTVRAPSLYVAMWLSTFCGAVVLIVRFVVWLNRRCRILAQHRPSRVLPDAGRRCWRRAQRRSGALRCFVHARGRPRLVQCRVLQRVVGRRLERRVGCGVCGVARLLPVSLQVTFQIKITAVAVALAVTLALGRVSVRLGLGLSRAVLRRRSAVLTSTPVTTPEQPRSASQTAAGHLCQLSCRRSTASVEERPQLLQW
jgi:hypothetical protein